MDILQQAKDVFAYTVKMRRHFHRHPECGPGEQLETMATIEAELESMGIPYVRVPKGGIFGFINGAKPGKTVLLRGDTDALPIEEDPYNLKNPRAVVSKVPGVMHACGHDGHMAMLLSEAKILKGMEAEMEGNVILMFEQGEEGHLNVENLCHYIQDQAFQIDTCYSTHVCWDVDSGKMACTEGSALSGIFAFRLGIHGTNGHGSRPDLAHSTVDCFVAIYEAIQAIRMKYIEPRNCLVWSVGELYAGTAHNVIPGELKSEGTVRFLDVASGQRFWAEFRRILDHICPLYYCTYTLGRRLFFTPVVNFAPCRKAFCDGVETMVGTDVLTEWGPWMASESFCYMASMYPSVCTFTGIRNVELGTGANHHTAQFDIDEAGLLKGVASAVAYVLEFQRTKPDTSAYTPLCHDMRTLVKYLREE